MSKSLKRGGKKSLFQDYIILKSKERKCKHSLIRSNRQKFKMYNWDYGKLKLIISFEGSFINDVTQI